MNGLVLYCAADLVWGTRIKAAAEDVGVQARPVRSAEMLAARLADSSPTGLIVDLEAEAAMDVLARLRADPRGEGVRVVAYGPHVEEGKFSAARAAGADMVMARGAFDRQLPSLLRRLAGDPPTVHKSLE